MKLFLDTNVLIDFILERPLFYQPAAMIVSLAAERKIDICVSALSVVTANFICIERCKMPLDVYRRKVDFLRNFIEVCSVDSSDINSSYEANWKDFEDGVQYFSAIRSADNRPRAQSRRQLQPSRQCVWIWRAGFLEMRSRWRMDSSWGRVVALFADLSINILPAYLSSDTARKGSVPALPFPSVCEK